MTIVYFPSRRWNIHLINQGTSRTRRGTRCSSRRIRWTLFSNPVQGDSTRDDAEAKNDFWSITGDFIYRHHVEPRVKLYVPREESFPIPLKYIDVTRNTHTSLDVLLEKILITGTWVEKENCRMHGQVSHDSFY